MSKIISLALSTIIFMLSTLSTLVSSEKIPSDFFNKIDPNFVEKLSDAVGITKNVVTVFLNEDVDFFSAKKIAKKINGKIVGYTSFMNEYKIEVKTQDSTDIFKICSEIEKDNRVIFASPQIVVNVKKCVLEQEKEKYIPNDPWSEGYFDWDEENPSGSNWHLEAIDALSAWQHMDRMEKIDLGIVDGGFFTNHEDLQGKIVFPNKYFERTNSIDSHGTHVAGIISANANNAIGVSGVCPNAVLHCVDWEPTFEDLSQVWVEYERIISGLFYTVMDGAKVVNFSLGLDMLYYEVSFPKIYLNLLGNTTSVYMAQLLKRGYDFIVCQAAGNGNEHYKAVNAENSGFFCSINESNCISPLFGVSKSDVLDRIIVVGNAQKVGRNKYIQNSSSNVGDAVDICAPGTDIYSTDIDKYGKYSYKTGTSMATPIVCGVCGLVWSIDSSFTGDLVKKIVCSPEDTVYNVEATDRQFYSGVGYQDYRMVNAKLAVEKAIEISNSGQK